jgi:hypothetical protein
MALEHQNISIGEADAATAGATAQDNWRDALLGHASGAWSVEEEFTSADTTKHWVVMKNDHTISGEDADFFVIIGRTVATGVIGVMVCEEYTAASNTVAKFAPNSQYNNQILVDGQFGASGSAVTYTLGNAWPSNTNGEPIFSAYAAAATMRLATSIEANYAVLSFNNHWYYVGYLTDLIVPETGLVATPAIACCEVLQGDDRYFGSITNHPIKAADAPLTVYNGHALQPIVRSQDIAFVCMQLQAFMTGIYGFEDHYQADRVAASEIAAIMLAMSKSSLATNNANKVGGLRAKFKGLRWTTGPVGAVAYDTIVVDGNKHVVLYVVGNLSSWNPYLYMPQPYNQNLVVSPMLVMDTGIPA